LGNVVKVPLHLGDQRLELAPILGRAVLCRVGGYEGLELLADLDSPSDRCRLTKHREQRAPEPDHGIGRRDKQSSAGAWANYDPTPFLQQPDRLIDSRARDARFVTQIAPGADVVTRL
jgi:hypothetical protein